jgi:fido (protein-threonine AMPylation protein)
VPPLYRTQEEKRSIEARNGALQFLAVLAEIEDWKPESKLTEKLIKGLQYRAIVNLYSCAGEFRDGPVRIEGVDHQPPDHSEVPLLVEQMCWYVNEHWQDRSPVHLAAYVMWRLNWIHPFFGGNGRTSRSTAYLVLCAKLGFRLPGETTIADYIVAARDAYINALQAADKAWLAGTVDLTAMEDLLEGLLAKQLLAVVVQATGRDIQ